MVEVPVVKVEKQRARTGRPVDCPSFYQRGHGNARRQKVIRSRKSRLGLKPESGDLLGLDQRTSTRLTRYRAVRGATRCAFRLIIQARSCFLPRKARAFRFPRDPRKALQLFLFAMKLPLMKVSEDL